MEKTKKEERLKKLFSMTILEYQNEYRSLANLVIEERGRTDASYARAKLKRMGWIMGVDIGLTGEDTKMAGMHKDAFILDKQEQEFVLHILDNKLKAGVKPKEIKEAEV